MQDNLNYHTTVYRTTVYHKTFVAKAFIDKPTFGILGNCFLTVFCLTVFF